MALALVDGKLGDGWGATNWREAAEPQRNSRFGRRLPSTPRTRMQAQKSPAAALRKRIPRLRERQLKREKASHQTPIAGAQTRRRLEECSTLNWVS